MHRTLRSLPGRPARRLSNGPLPAGRSEYRFPAHHRKFAVYLYLRVTKVQCSRPHHAAGG
jgi:hypothetical protein